MRPRHKLNLICILAITVLGCLQANGAGAEIVLVKAAGFSVGTGSVGTGTNQISLQLDESNVPMPFCQSAVKQETAPALLGPDPKIPYFAVRFALPIPPENTSNLDYTITGIGDEVFTHNHSPGFEILPNGDALAVYFSTPPGKSENDLETSFIQARLRYGAVEWDLPELFFKTEGLNDQAALLWNDGGTIRFFGGGRGFSDWVPFKMAASTDNGATWTFSLPQLNKPATDYTAQPIGSAFRSPDGSMYFAMDGTGPQSFLWQSTDEGAHWNELAGRTGARHSVIAPLDDRGDLLSIGGKNANVNGWSPENFSTNWGASWSKSEASPFPPLGNAQHPSLIRLADGDLFFVSDSWLQKEAQPTPATWNYGNNCFVAISTNNGDSWHIKPLPVQLPNHIFRTYGTLGYVTARQAPNGVIHILTSATQPCLHYELNEAWVFSDAGDIAPETTGGTVREFSENYPDGRVRSRWSARICPHGRYLLDGRETDFYDNGRKQHQVTYASGRKTGMETFWLPDGHTLCTWSHDLKHNTAVWIQYWPNGRKKSESSWNTESEARDLARSFFGLVADGPAHEWAEDGILTRTGLFVDGVETK